MKKHYTECYYDERQMLIEPIGGLANRVRVIIAAVVYCEDVGVDLCINWLNDPNCCQRKPWDFSWIASAFLPRYQRVEEIAGGHFEEVFVTSNLSDKIKITFVSQREHARKNKKENSFSNFYRGHGASFFKGGISDFQKKIERAYKNLKTTPQLQSSINSFFLKEQPYHAVHIRRTDHLSWLDRMDLEVTPLAKFENFIKQKKGRVFLATDCIKTRDYLIKKYPTQVFSKSKLHKPDSRVSRPTDLQQAVVDIFLCAKARSFLGTRFSSFSDLINTLRETKI